MLASKERTWLKKAHPGIIIGPKGLEFSNRHYQKSAAAVDMSTNYEETRRPEGIRYDQT
jgi:hypothetical protein